jgi:hypothetical protein
MAAPSYQLSFTAGGLLQQEATALIEVYLRTRSWDETAKEARDRNLLQARTASSSVRVLRETRLRLATLEDPFLEAYPLGTPADQQQTLWIAVCRRYQLLRDFARELVHERFLQLNLLLSYEDFDRFLESKAVWHAEIDGLAATTRAKLRQVTFRMLREAGILAAGDVIQPVLMSPELARLVQRFEPEAFSLFPLHMADVARALA